MLQELNVEEVPYCRVCHEGDTSNSSIGDAAVSLGPLYHPCKCDGSIKYVHQECLIQWLKISKKFQTNPKCELCGELFHFQNIYALDAPSNVLMTLKDTLIELLPRMLLFIKYITGLLFTCTVWVVFLPLFSNYWMKFCWCLISTRDMKVCETRLAEYWRDLGVRVMAGGGGYWSLLHDPMIIEQWSLYWYNGVVNICIIICVSVVCYELGNIVYKEIQLAELRDRIRGTERRIQINRDTLAFYEELNIQEEYTIFATEDYLALLVEWEEYQRQPKPYYNLRPPMVESISPARKEMIIDAIKLDRRYSQRITYRLDILMTLISTPAFDHIKTSCINLRDVIDQQAEMTEATMSMIDLAYNTRSLLETVTVYKNNAINGEALTASQRDRIESILRKTKSPSSDDHNINNNNNTLSFGSSNSDTTDEMTDSIKINIVQKDAPPRTKDKKNIARDKKNGSSKQQQQQSNIASTKSNAFTNASMNTNGKTINTTKSSGQHQQQQQQAPSSSSSRYKLADPPAGDDTIKLNILREDLIRNRNAALEMKAHAERLQTLMLEGKSAAARANANAVYASRHQHQPILPIRPTPPPPVHTAAPRGNPIPPVRVGTAAEPPLDPVIQPVELAALIPGAAAAAVAPAVNEGIPISFIVISTVLSFVYVFIFIIFIVVIPAHVGRYISSLWFLSSSDDIDNNDAVKRYIFSSINKGNSAILFMKLFDIPEIDELTATMKLYHQVDGHVISDELYSKLRAMFEVSVGYSFYMTSFFAIYVTVCVFCASQNTRNNFYQNQVSELLKVQFDVAVRTINTIIKGKLLFILYGVVIPFTSSSLILKFLSRRLPVEMQFTIINSTTTTTTYGNAVVTDADVGNVRGGGVTMTSSHVLVMVTLFLFSHLLMIHSRYLAFVLRQLIDKKYLSGFLPEVNVLDFENEQNHLQSFHDRLMRITYLQIVKSLLINCSTFLIGIIVSAIIPIRFGHVLCPIAEPLQFRLKSVVMDIQMPVEMVLCHILLPTLIEKMHYKAVFKNVLKTYFKAMTQLLDLQWLASNEVFPETAAAAVVVVDHVDHPALLQNAPEVQHSVADSGPLVRAVESSPSTTAIYDEASLSSVDIGVTVTNTCHKKISSDDVCSAIVNDDEDEDDDNQHHSIESPIQQLPSSSIIATTSLSSITSCESSSDASITSIESSSDASIINNVTTNVLSSIKGTSETTRLSVFIVVGMILLATISSWLLHCPLTVGRRLIDMLHVSTDNDVFNYPVGLAFCGAIAFVLNFIVQDLVLNRDVVGVMNVVWKWSVRALQFVLVGMYWLVVPPFMLGIIFESLFLNPIRGNTSVFSFSLLECWAFGLIGLKIWTQCVLVGLFGDIDMRVSLEVIVMRGFAQFDAWYCIRSVIIPVSLRLLDYSLVPYLVSLTIQKGANHFFFIPVAYIPFIDHFHHWRYHVYVALRIVIFTCETTYKYIIRIHRQVRDSKYLIGTQLHNRPNGDPPMTLPLGVSTIPPPSSSSSSPSPSLLEQQAVVTSSSSSSSPIVDI